MAASHRVRRIGKEIADIRADTHSQIGIEPFGDQDDVTHLRGSFPGPPGTPYEGGTFAVDVKIPTDYPFTPPAMRFETKVWHPNISSQTGAICLDTLSSAWSPVLTVKSALLSLQQLLSTPEPKDPQDAEVAKMMMNTPAEFARVARKWTVLYAGAPPKPDEETQDAVASTQVATEEDNLARYQGYNKDLVDRFGNMGFDVAQVVDAFQQVKVDRNAGEDYELDPVVMANVTARLTLRATTNAVASERVRAALRRAREARQSATPSAAGTPQTGSDAESKVGDEKAVDCLTPEEELVFVRYYCETLLELGDEYKPPLPTAVRATAIQYLRRFYLTNSPMTYHPKTIMACALFLATKTDNYYMSLRHFTDGIPGKPSPDEVVAPEFLLMQGLRFSFDVRHPLRGLEGGVMELSAIAQGQGQPSPLQPHQTPESLKNGLLSIAPPPTPSSSITDRIGRAHTGTRELLKTAAQMTDAYFLYTPSQIWLSAFFLADRPLAEFYLDTKLGGPITPTAASTNPSGLQNPLYEMRTKVFKAQMKNLKRIAKKLYKCQNPEKANLSQKRDSAQPPTSAAITDSGQVTSESETERLAKKRKLDEQKQRGSQDLFGPELVLDRTK
ncbi:hypothetical protein N7532_006859 [Penicillium argentinense]|uniref:Ubiquitin-conjugating enzyme E2 1 n=1 Tax=Penicillium argentinense TaxID=1131581 RepID=A0A9W9FGP9_9EURO|nr:uncharacterized protein N7532_006859 [Penicillium argentinense]KAJ5099858.1 hypothetical protein N7532_006859 [Penicillium argentinense]